MPQSSTKKAQIQNKHLLKYITSYTNLLFNVHNISRSGGRSVLSTITPYQGWNKNELPLFLKILKC